MLKEEFQASLKEKKKDEEFKEQLKVNLENFKNQQTASNEPKNVEKNPNNIPEHLAEVNPYHQQELKCYKMRYKALGNGACLENCVAVHIYEDEQEGVKVKRRVNHHVADNWDNYYMNKIVLPYRETVGVGETEKVVVKHTREEMLEFLRSDDALMVYSNTQELLAVANLFNININIFTYEGKEGIWIKICPDPEMAESAELRFGKWAPDMALYIIAKTPIMTFF